MGCASRPFLMSTSPDQDHVYMGNEATTPREERRPRHEDQDRGGARGTGQELLGAGNGQQAPITILKWWFWDQCWDRRCSLTQVTDTGPTGMGRSPGLYPCYVLLTFCFLCRKPERTCRLINITGSDCTTDRLI
eukprot:scaffold107060_cov57-Attheya_sp.AAC.1